MFGEGMAKAVTFGFIVVAVVSAVTGWGIIEGIIWLFKHISITLI
jgi:hypothetical protein